MSKDFSNVTGVPHLQEGGPGHEACFFASFSYWAPPWMSIPECLRRSCLSPLKSQHLQKRLPSQPAWYRSRVSDDPTASGQFFSLRFRFLASWYHLEPLLLTYLFPCLPTRPSCSRSPPPLPCGHGVPPSTCMTFDLGVQPGSPPPGSSTMCL